MASLSTLSRAPNCLNCLRRTFLDDGAAAFQYPSRMQWRGKKKLPKATTIPIRLLRDIPRYGRKGSLIAVPPATMRNQFFPSQSAAYLTMQERKTLKDQVTERERTFGVKAVPGATSKEDQILAQQNAGPRIRRFEVSAERTLELLQKFVPPTLEYFRAVLMTPPVSAAGAANPNVPDSPVPTTALLGSVTTRDIASSIGSYLSDGAQAQGEKQAAQVVVLPEDIEIAGVQQILGRSGEVADGDADRVTSLGEYDITIRISGSEKLKRRIRVLPEAAPESVMSQTSVDASL